MMARLYQSEKTKLYVYLKDDDKALPVGKKTKVISLMKDELGGKIMTLLH